MLHRLLLRLSLFIAVLIFSGLGALHFYKKDILLFVLNYFVQKELTHSVVSVGDVDFSLPFKMTLREVTLKEKNTILLNAHKIKISFNPFLPVAATPSLGQHIVCFDQVSLNGLQVFDMQKKEFQSEKKEEQKTNKKLFHFFPKIGIRNFSMDGVFDNQYVIDIKGQYFYDASAFSFSVGKKEQHIPYQGTFTTYNQTGAVLQTQIKQFSVKTSFNLEDVWKGESVPFSAEIENMFFFGEASCKKNRYALSIFYEKNKKGDLSKNINPAFHFLDKANLKIRWDQEKNHIICDSFDAKTSFPDNLAAHKYLHIQLEKPVTFSVQEQTLLGDLKMKCAHTSWTLSHLNFNNPLKGTLKGRVFLSKVMQDFFPHNTTLQKIKGNVDVEAVLSGSLDEPVVSCRLSPHQFSFSPDVDLKLSVNPFLVRYKNQKINLEGGFALGKGLKATLKGEFSQKENQNSIDASLKIFSDLSLLKNFFPEKERIAGICDGVVTLKGPVTHLTLQGEGFFKKGLYGNYAVGTHIQSIEGKWSLKDDKLTLSAHGNDDFKGHVKGNGVIFFPWMKNFLQANFQNMHPLVKGRMDLFLKDFFIGQSDLFTAKAEGNLFLNFDNFLIGGKIFLDPTIVDLDQLTPSPTPKITLKEHQLKSDLLLDRHETEDLEEKDTHKKDEDISQEKGLFRFDIEAFPKTPVIVRGFGVESVWDGKLSLKNFSPDFIGEFRIRHGTIDITERILKFTKGKIIFDGKIKNPYLDLEIKKEIDKYDVKVRFKGRAKDPHFTFVSSPALSEEEVLALILFGRKSAVTSLGQLFDVSSSLSSLSGAGQKKNFFTKFRQTFGIDALELKPQNPTSPSKSPQALSIRKRMSDDVDLVLEQGFNDNEESSKSSKASIEKKINDQWSLEVDASTDKSGGLGLNWVKRY